MAPVAPSEPRSGPRLHPTVGLGYLVRLAMLPLGSVVLYMVFLGAGRTGGMLIPALAAYGLVWPHLAYRVAKSSRNTKSAEHLNLLIDGFLIGCWIGALHFNLWPATMLGGAVIAGMLSVGGLRVAGLGAMAMIVGAALVGGYLGFPVDQSAGPLVVALCAGGITLYMAVFGYHSHVQSRRVVRSRRELKERHEEIQEKSRLLEEAVEEAESANRAKSMFLASMSHELRTPLNAIIGYSELLIEEAADEGETELTEDLQRIALSGKHLLGLINDVLDLAKIEAGRMELSTEEFRVADMVEEVAVTTRALVEANRNTFRVRQEGELGTMSADALKLRQVLLNLLSNAAKFTEEGEVTLAVARVPDGADDRMVFRVIDTGIGMTPEQVGRIFQPFVQAEAGTSVKYGGTGLGLALSRRFARMMGGELMVESEAGVGSTFTLTLPVTEAGTDLTGTEPEAGMESAGGMESATGMDGVTSIALAAITRAR